MNRKTRILIVDDHFVVREGLASIIRRDGGMEVVGECANGMEAVSAYGGLLPDVVIMDLRMPVLGGVDAIRMICGEHSGARVLVLSNFDGDEDIHAALEAGALGYLFKHTSGDQIVPAVRALMDGGRWVPPEVAARLSERKSFENLTVREREILHLLVLGEANKEVADALGISEHTVKSHVKSILAKLKVRDRTEAVTVALRRGIMHLPEV